ncbi:MAG: Clp protease ClpS [Bacteroidetes bacterium]|nr:MAG: Clp protease ClpS [Bacteroidota bacterium]
MAFKTHIKNFYFSSVETEEEVLVDIQIVDEWKLVVYNDDHNTFDHVIEKLVASCGHEPLQAEQCAMIIHFKGKCVVKSGPFEKLEPMCTSLLESDITAEVEP